MLRRAIDATNRAISRVRRNRRIRIPAHFNTVNVNLGCGLAIAPGWVNIDGSMNALLASFPSSFFPIAYKLTGANRYYSVNEYVSLLTDNYFVHHDLSYNIPLEDGCVDNLYSSHFLEHLHRADAISLLKECRRVLKPGGRLRLSIPDLKYAVQLYLSGERDKSMRDFFFVEDKENDYSRHKYMYDFEMISSILQDVGFTNVTKSEYQIGEVPDLDKLDNREQESLFVEACLN
jgi:SAM-dependent methyltransferase